MNPPRPSAQDVYDRLRELILSFELYPGSRVTESALAERFGVSRTPVREALQRLASEGHVTVLPKQGVLIRQLDAAELAQHYRVRVVLELAVLADVCANASDADLRALAADWDPQAQPGRSDDFAVMAARDEAFHRRLAELGGNRVMAQLLEQVGHHIRAVRRLDFTLNDRVERTYEEHHAIAQCLLARDLRGARRLLRRHIENSRRVASAVSLEQLRRVRAAALGEPG